MGHKVDVPDRENYRVWVYNKIDGEVIGKIVGADEAEQCYDDGWQMTPAAFTDKEELKNEPTFEAAANDIANVLNMLLNIDSCDDIVILRDFATNFLNMTIPKKITVEKLRQRIKVKAEEEGMYDANS